MLYNLSDLQEQKMCEKSLSPIKRISSSKSPTMNSKSGHNYYKIQYSKCSYALYIIIVLCLIHPTLQQNTNIRKTKQQLLQQQQRSHDLKLKKFKQNIAEHYVGVGALKNFKQLPMCVIGEAKNIEDQNFGSLFAQNYSNYHLVILGQVQDSFLQFSKNQLKIKIDNPSWNKVTAGYYQFKYLLENYCGEKELVFILRGKLKDQNALQRLNSYFQKLKVWTLYYYDIKFYHLYINAFYRQVYFRLDSNDFNWHYRQHLRQSGFETASMGMFSIDYKHTNTTKIQQLYSNMHLQSFVLSTYIDVAQVNMRKEITYQQLMFSSQTKIIDPQLYEIKHQLGDNLANHILQNDITLKQIQRFLEMVQMKNLPTNHSLFQLDRIYMEEKHQLNLYKRQLPMCVVILSHNNIEDDRYKKIMQTILYQNYSNYHIVFIDDFSSDTTLQATQEYVEKVGFPQSRIKYIRNQYQKYATYNIYNAAHNYCKKDQIFVLLDGDDEVVGRQVFRLINKAYLKEKMYPNWLVYTNYYSTRFQIGQSKEVIDPFLDDPSRFRQKQRHFFGMIRTFITELFRKIKQVDHRDKNGEFFNIVYDQAMQQPLLQMAGRHIEYVPQLCYLYNKQFNNFGTNLSEKRRRIHEVNDDVLSRKRYERLESLFSGQQFQQ